MSLVYRNIIIRNYCGLSIALYLTGRSKATEMLSVRSGEMKTLQDQHVAMTDKIENLTSQVFFFA